LEQLLAQHAIVTVRLTRARLRDDADLAQTAEEALTKNTDELGAVVESAYGSGGGRAVQAAVVYPCQIAV
jgi:hypothetical protein